MSDIFAPLPKGKFSVILADPPWDYNNCVQHGGTKQGYTSSARSFYPTLTLNQLGQLDIRSLSEKDTILFMWTTGPQLEKSLQLLDLWSFRYKTVAFVWEKARVNPGAYTMSSCEYVLAATRGSIPKPRGSRNVRQFFSQARTRHSEKPEEIHKRIEAMFPAQKKLELFARKPRSGWTCWGNEIK